jgi:hypothetical protein
VSDLIDPSGLVETSDDSKGTKLRLLVCKTCNSIQPLPDYEGPIDHDETLLARVAEHQYPGPAPTRGHELELGRVSEASWNDPEKQAQMLGEIKKNVGVGKGAGLGNEAYAVRDNFAADAMKCWRFEHGRTSNCDDYMSDKKKILADSRAERKDLGLDPKTRASIKLCQFCPYHSVVMQRKRKAAGQYS